MNNPNKNEKFHGSKHENHRKHIAVLSVIAAILVLLGLSFLIGRPLLSALKNKESFRLWIGAQGFWKYLIMVGIVAVQVIIAIIPGGPIEFAAGYAFGAWGGLLLCLMGIVLASLSIVLLTRKYGMRMVRLFLNHAKIEELSEKLLKDKSKLETMVFILFLIPGLPKDLITYFIGITAISIPRFLFISAIARIPSILSSAMGGSMVGKQRYKEAFALMILTMIVSAVIFIIYHILTKMDKTGLGQQKSTDMKDVNDQDV